MARVRWLHMGHAEELRDELRRDGVEAVQRILRNATAEAEWVDYKRAVAPKDNLSRAVTAFANTSGGIVLWGVDAPSPRPERSEAPVDARAEDAAKFRTELEGLTSAAADPPVLGVEHLVIPIDGGPRGYVATYVPASPSAPHRDIHKVHRLRVGSSTIEMPHGLFAAYFGRRPTPSLSLVVAVTCLDAPEQDVVRAEFEFLARNNGDGPLSDLYFSAVRVGLQHDSAGPPVWDAGDARPYSIYKSANESTRPFSFSSFARSDYRVAPRGLAAIAQLSVYFSRAGMSPSCEFEGILGAVGATTVNWRLYVVPPPPGLLGGSKISGDSPASRGTYCNVLLTPDRLTGGEFLHAARQRLEADHGVRPRGS